jgi:hypothetical protein
MGTCLCVKPEVQNEILKNEKKKSKGNLNEFVSENPKVSEDFEKTQMIRNPTTKATRKKSNNKLSCDEYWDEIKNNTNFQKLIVKNDLRKVSESKNESDEPRVMTFQTNTNYSITIIEVNNKIVNPNEVFFIENKEMKVGRPSSPANTQTKLKTHPKNLDIDHKITESIKSNVGFDKLYDEVLSKHLCKNK